MRITTVLLAGVLAGATLPAAAETFPTATVDYAAKVRFEGGDLNATMRHREGMLRMETKMDEDTPSVFLLDTRKGTGVMLMDMGDDKVAMEVGGAGGAPVSLPKTGEIDAKKSGKDTVAGQPCDLWTYADPATKGLYSSCVTTDGIVLRVDDMEGGVRKTVMQVTSLDRAKQDPALFKVPAGYTRMQMPTAGGAMMPKQ